ncbi:MAG: cupin domain-containing protein [Rhodobiaceae bacterium]|nr:cupin domain-containing protein [Rhodobiaceae bacterium]
MAMTEGITGINVQDLKEFSAETRVRKKLIHSQMLSSEVVYYAPGQETVLHLHPKQDEVFYVVEGSGAITFEDDEIAVTAGSLVFVPAGIRHGVRTDPESQLVLLFTKGPGVPPPTVRN